MNHDDYGRNLEYGPGPSGSEWEQRAVRPVSLPFTGEGLLAKLMAGMRDMLDAVSSRFPGFAAFAKANVGLRSAETEAAKQLHDEANHRLKLRNEIVANHNATVHRDIEAIQRRHESHLEPLDGAILQIEAVLQEASVAVATAEAEFEAITQCEPPRAGWLTMTYGLKPVSEPGSGLKRLANFAAVISGSVVGLHCALALLDPSALESGDLVSLCKVLLLVVAGAVGMSCFKGVAYLAGANARDEIDNRNLLGALAWLLVAVSVVATGAGIETNVVRAGVAKASYSSVLSGALSATDVRAAGWALGVFLSLAVLLLAAIMGIRYGSAERRQKDIEVAGEKELEDRIPQAQVDQARIGALVARAELDALKQSLADLRQARAEMKLQHETEIENLKSRLQPLDSKIAAEDHAAIQRMQRSTSFETVRLEEELRALANLFDGIPPSRLSFKPRRHGLWSLLKSKVRAMFSLN